MVSHWNFPTNLISSDSSHIGLATIQWKLQRCRTNQFLSINPCNGQTLTTSKKFVVFNLYERLNWHHSILSVTLADGRRATEVIILSYINNNSLSWLHLCWLAGLAEAGLWISSKRPYLHPQKVLSVSKFCLLGVSKHPELCEVRPIFTDIRPFSDWRQTCKPHTSTRVQAQEFRHMITSSQQPVSHAVTAVSVS